MQQVMVEKIITVECGIQAKAEKVGLRKRSAGREGSRVLGPGLPATLFTCFPLSCPIGPYGLALHLRNLLFTVVGSMRSLQL